eukprot:1141471-Pelagomonas_calceolata.AAC.2
MAMATAQKKPWEGTNDEAQLQASQQGLPARICWKITGHAATRKTGHTSRSTTNNMQGPH